MASTDRRSLLAKTPEELGFDPEALRRKYDEERDKRIRREGSRQYSALDGDFERLARDPFHPERTPRAPSHEEVEVLVVGAGHCGLLTAVNLLDRGIDDIRLIDGAADFGGTWYWNRYPGIRCDIESYVYMPLLEETGYVPREKYASGQEIFEHCRRIGRHYGLYDKTYFQTHVDSAEWSEEESVWHVRTDRGDAMKARFVVMALGPLNKPRLPGIPGLGRFEGHVFHTSRWDYAYTGGSPDAVNPRMEKLGDKRVGIVGTGCTGLQCAPQVAKYARHLYVFQRTPAAVNARENEPTDPEWERQLGPGWQYERIENFARIMLGEPLSEDLVRDKWTDAAEIFAATFAPGDAGEGSPEEVDRYSRLIDYQKMEAIRRRVDDVVEDPETAERLKPWYRLFCKRPTFSDDYLPMFNRPNVTLVDTEGQGVDEATAKGLVVAGVEYPLDCIIFASGYEVNTDYCRRGGLEIHGREGRSLSEEWSSGVRTLFGYMSHGFPNMMHVGALIGNAVSANFTGVFLRYAARVAELIDHVRESDKEVIEPTADAEERWVEVVRQCFEQSKPFFAECTPGYYNAEGRVDAKEALTHDVYSPGIYAFEKVVQDWIDDGMPGVVLR